MMCLMAHPQNDERRRSTPSPSGRRPVVALRVCAVLAIAGSVALAVGAVLALLAGAGHLSNVDSWQGLLNNVAEPVGLVGQFCGMVALAYSLASQWTPASLRGTTFALVAMLFLLTFPGTEASAAVIDTQDRLGWPAEIADLVAAGAWIILGGVLLRRHRTSRRLADRPA